MVTGWLAGSAATVGTREYQDDVIDWVVVPAPRGGRHDGLLLALADGMGGYRGGARAAAIATAAAAQSVLASTRPWPDLAQACAAADRALAIAKQDELRDEPSAGCTLVLCLFREGALLWSSIGDSLLWQVGADGLRRLNRDHSMAPVLDHMAAQGDITAEDAATDPNRNVLRSAVTGGGIRLLDTSDSPLPVARSTRIVAATDGVLALEPNAIAALARRGEPADGAAAIVAAIDGAGADSRDNATVGICRRAAGWRGWFGR